MVRSLLQAGIVYTCFGIAQCWILSGPRALTPRSAAANIVNARQAWSGTRLRGHFHDGEWISSASDDDDAEQAGSSIAFSSDWLQAELTLKSSPKFPNPDLLPHQVATICCRSLQWIDYPAVDAGLRRCYRFFTPECRRLVTGRQYSSAADDSLEQFCHNASLSPALQPFMGATRLDVGDVTLTPAHPPARGALASVPIVIHGAPVLSVQHASGMARSGVASSPPTTHTVMRLEEQRRPPLQACWMVREIMDVRHAFAGDMGNSHVGE
jgi:hypothetical protein